MSKRIRKSLTLKWMILLTLLAVIPLIIACLSILQIYHEDLRNPFIEVGGMVLILGIPFSFFLTRKFIPSNERLSKEMEQELVQRNRELETVYEMGALINEHLGDLDVILPITLKKVTSLTGYEMGAIYLLNETGDVLEMKSQIGHSPAMLQEVKVLKFNEGVSGKAIRLKQPVIVSISEYPSPRIVPILREEGVQTVVGIPLLAEGKAIGAIILSSRSPHRISPKEVNSLESIGSQIGLALENSLLLNEIRESEKKYRTLVESAIDGVCVIGRNYLFKYVNERLAEIHGYRREELIGTDFRNLLDEESRTLLTDREDKRARGIKSPPHFELNFLHKDGGVRNAEISASAIKDSKGDVNIIVFLKDITDRRKAEESSRQSEEEAKRLSQENAIMVEIGRIISSTLNIDDVYERFAEEVCKFIQFERITINNINPKENTFVVLYNVGPHVADREVGKPVPLPGTATEWVMQNRSSLLILEANREEMLGRIPGLLPIFKAWFRSMMLIPLISKDQVIGTLALQTAKQNAYTEVDLKLAERVSAQIAGAIANAQLFMESKQAEEKYRAIIRTAMDGFWMVDMQGRFWDVNDAYCQLIGYSRDELLTMRISDVEGEERPEDTARRIQKIMEVGGDRFETHHKCKDGRIINVEISVNYMEVNGGRMFVFLRDITEHKQAEEALKRSEETARHLSQENATMAEIGRIISSTLNIDEVYELFAEKVRELVPFDRININIFNPRDDTLLTAYVTGLDVPDRLKGNAIPVAGTLAEEVIRTRTKLFIQAEDQKKVIDRFPGLLPVFQAGIRSLVAIPMVTKDEVIGVLHLQSCKPNAYVDKDLTLAERVGNQIAGAIANAQLYFERSQVEEALRRSEERYRTILEDIQEGYFEVDLAGNFTFVNDAECRNLGYSKEELIGMSNRQYTDEKNAKKMYDLFNEVYKTGKTAKGYDLEFIKKDGTKTFSEISVSLVRDSEGKQIGFRGISRDVTERKRMEEQLLQAEKLRAVGEMASGVAHDFNNALAAILGNTQLLLYTTHDEELKETLKIIEKVAKDSGQTIRRLQDFTKKRVDQELFKVNVNSIIKDSMEMTKPKWKDEPQSRGIRIEMVSNLEEIPSVSGNASELREVITNMIFNAIEAMSEGGKIEIRTFKKRRDVFIQISDSGIGIAEEAERKIFEPFFTTKPFTNTGLGLSMSYGIIKRFGGEIEVESKVGQGTTFTIILPIGGEEKEEAVSPQTIKKGRKARILVIDDDEFVRSVLSRTLAQANHQVTLAENGEKGVQLFKEGKFDIVLTDLGMPGMSGWEVCRIIKEISPYTPVGMITGWGMEKNRNEVEEYGLDFFISKPFDFNQILNVVSETMASKEE